MYVVTNDLDLSNPIDINNISLILINLLIGRKRS